jgi:hypothetical protein
MGVMDTVKLSKHARSTTQSSFEVDSWRVPWRLGRGGASPAGACRTESACAGSGRSFLRMSLLRGPAQVGGGRSVLLASGKPRVWNAVATCVLLSFHICSMSLLPSGSSPVQHATDDFRDNALLGSLEQIRDRFVTGRQPRNREEFWGIPAVKTTRPLPFIRTIECSKKRAFLRRRNSPVHLARVSVIYRRSSEHRPPGVSCLPRATCHNRGLPAETFESMRSEVDVFQLRCLTCCQTPGCRKTSESGSAVYVQLLSLINRKPVSSGVQFRILLSSDCGWEGAHVAATENSSTRGSLVR